MVPWNAPGYQFYGCFSVSTCFLVSLIQFYTSWLPNPYSQSRPLPGLQPPITGLSFSFRSLNIPRTYAQAWTLDISPWPLPAPPMFPIPIMAPPFTHQAKILQTCYWVFSFKLPIQFISKPCQLYFQNMSRTQSFLSPSTSLCLMQLSSSILSWIKVPILYSYFPEFCSLHYIPAHQLPMASHWRRAKGFPKFVLHGPDPPVSKVHSYCSTGTLGSLITEHFRHSPTSGT